MSCVVGFGASHRGRVGVEFNTVDILVCWKNEIAPLFINYALNHVCFSTWRQKSLWSRKKHVRWNVGLYRE